MATYEVIGICDWKFVIVAGKSIIYITGMCETDNRLVCVQ